MTSSQYRFVGTECDIVTDTKTGKKVAFKLFGQSAILSDDIARDAVLHGRAAIVPAEKFPASITADELKRYGTPRSREGALPQEFVVKLREAWAALAAYRQSLLSPPVPAKAEAVAKPVLVAEKEGKA